MTKIHCILPTPYWQPAQFVNDQIFVLISGTGPDAFFYVGKKGSYVHSANQKGIWIPYPIWSQSKLSAYNGNTIRLELDKDLNVNELGWLSVWCRQYAVDFGHVYLIESVNNPNPHKEIYPDRIHFVDNAYHRNWNVWFLMCDCQWRKLVR